MRSMAKKLVLGLVLALGLASAPAGAQTVTKICLPITSTASGIAVTSCYDISASNPFPVTGSFTPSGTQDVNLTKVGGAAVALGQASAAASIPVVSATDYAQGSTTSGQLGPLIQGAVTTLAPTYVTGQTSPLGLTTSGEVRVRLTAGSSILGVTATVDGLSNPNNTLDVSAFQMLWNGSTWDRGFTCANTAQVSVTAGSTTQIVALSGTTVIRVCSFALSISLTGTAQFVSGTGSNCGTPTVLTPAMALTTAVPWTMVGPTGSSVLRGTAGGELCIAAVTGNVTGFVNYAQY